MKKIKPGFIHPSAALTIKKNQICYHDNTSDFVPRVGDMIYGQVMSIAQHATLENIHGRIHAIHEGKQGIFVFGNRYAPDYYEAIVPEQVQGHVDLLARSGMIGCVRQKNMGVKDPTKIKVIGRVCSKEGFLINTTDYPIVFPKHRQKHSPRAKLILVVGTSMNSGKSLAAAACCWALSTMGHEVRGSKVTGTASLKDILHMNDAGASQYNDFTYLGYPSTYLLQKEEVLRIFNTLDLKYANNPKNYWVVELADGIIQRETAMLLQSDDVRSRIHKLIFCASDAFGAIGGVKILKERFNLLPDALSGVCSSSPLAVQELNGYVSVPVFQSASPDLKQMAKLLV